MWSWLNPANLIKILTLGKALLDGAMTIFNLISDYFRKKDRAKKQEEPIKKVEENIETQAPVEKKEKDEIDFLNS